jgi:hypothetical protein
VSEANSGGVAIHVNEVSATAVARRPRLTPGGDAPARAGVSEVAATGSSEVAASLS